MEMARAASERLTWQFGVYRPATNVFGIALNKAEEGEKLAQVKTDLADKYESLARQASSLMKQRLPVIRSCEPTGDGVLEHNPVWLNRKRSNRDSQRLADRRVCSDR